MLNGQQLLGIITFNKFFNLLLTMKIAKEAGMALKHQTNNNTF